MIPLLVGLGIVVLFLLVVVAIYNRLVALRHRHRNGFSQIDVQLKRRYDLIPNLVEATRSYLQHERGTLEAVVAARNAASTARNQIATRPDEPGAIRALAGAEGALAGAMSRFMAVVEAYPNLKANQSIAELTEELATTENRVAFARQAYNDAVMEYNIAREKFPNFLIAGPCGFHPADLFEIESPQHREAPKVRLG